MVDKYCDVQAKNETFQIGHTIKERSDTINELRPTTGENVTYPSLETSLIDCIQNGSVTLTHDHSCDMHVVPLYQPCTLCIGCCIDQFSSGSISVDVRMGTVQTSKWTGCCHYVGLICCHKVNWCHCHQWHTDELSEVYTVYYAGRECINYNYRQYEIELLLRSGETRCTGIKPEGLVKARLEALRWHELIFGRDLKNNTMKDLKYIPPSAETLHKPGTPHDDFIEHQPDGDGGGSHDNSFSDTYYT
jgi:hypothetical protein